MSKKTILITGGLGYIGSHTIVELFNKEFLSSFNITDEFEVVIIDDCTNCKEKVLEIIEKITGAKMNFFKIDILDKDKMEEEVFKKFNIFAIIHFAAKKFIAECFEKPLYYYQNNVGGTVNLIELCLKYNVNNFIFSSSCSVYGVNSENSKEDEVNLIPINPYSRTKLYCEKILIDTAIAHKNFRAVILRYCNPVSAHKSGELGEDPLNPHKMLFPVIISHIKGEREKIVIFGDDYDTKDGTCIRDYFHIMDLAQSHCLVLKCFNEENKNLLKDNYTIYNVGTNKGYSVKEVLEAYSEVCGKKFKIEIGARRKGDAVKAYPNCDKIQRELGWKPKATLKEMCQDDYNFYLKHPNGL